MKNIFAGSHTEHHWRCSNYSPNCGLYKCNFGFIGLFLFVFFFFFFFFFFGQLHFTTIFKCEINLTSPKIIHTIEYLCLGWLHYGSSYGAVHLPSTNIHSVILQKNIVHYIILICLFLKFVYVKSLVH